MEPITRNSVLDLILSYLKERKYQVSVDHALWDHNDIEWTRLLTVGGAEIIYGQADPDVVSLYDYKSPKKHALLSLHSPTFFEDLEKAIKEINGQA